MNILQPFFPQRSFLWLTLVINLSSLAFRMKHYCWNWHFSRFSDIYLRVEGSCSCHKHFCPLNFLKFRSGPQDYSDLIWFQLVIIFCLKRISNFFLVPHLLQRLEYLLDYCYWSEAFSVLLTVPAFYWDTFWARPLLLYFQKHLLPFPDLN